MKIRFLCMKMKFCPKISVDENSMHLVVYSPNIFRGEKIKEGAKFIFIHEHIIFPCMKMKYFMREIFMPRFFKQTFLYRAPGIQRYSENPMIMNVINICEVIHW